MNYEKEITANLLNYLIDGVLDGVVSPHFDGTTFPAITIVGRRFQFIRKYEDVELITDPAIIPVLVITAPDQYYKGKVIYKGTFTDLKSILINSEPEGDLPQKINFYVIPKCDSITGNIMGSLTYSLDIDYVADFDVYGFIADEVSSIVKRMYQKEQCGQFHTITADGKSLHVVPDGLASASPGTILARIAHTYAIRACNFA